MIPYDSLVCFVTVFPLRPSPCPDPPSVTYTPFELKDEKDYQQLIEKLDNEDLLRRRVCGMWIVLAVKCSENSLIRHNSFSKNMVD